MIVFMAVYDEIAAPQLAIDCQVKHGKVAAGVLILEMQTDRPNILGLDEGVLANQLTLVSGFALFDGVHSRLLVC